jgi:hypothetical protein
VARHEGARARTGGNGLTAFLAYLDEIEHALLARDALRLTSLLRKRTASHLPRAVREELLMLSRAPRESYRAPVQLLRFRHRMQQLAAGGERLLTAQTELRLESPASAGEARRRTAADRQAACDSDGPAGADHDADVEA